MQPTEADLNRDMVADLALCDAASPAPWKAIEDVRGVSEWRIVREGSAIVGTLSRDPNALMVAAAREGWPAAIRRALAAEAERDRLSMMHHEAADDRQRLEAENAALRAQVEGHCRRIAAQSELLSRRAEKEGH